MLSYSAPAGTSTVRIAAVVHDALGRYNGWGVYAAVAPHYLDCLDSWQSKSKL